MHDKTYGLRIAQSNETNLAIADEQLVWLEVADCQNLQQLTVTGQSPQPLQAEKHHERHLTLSGVPQLQQIQNPQQLPLVVHFDVRDREQPLLIEGPVRQVDFCWNGGEYANTRTYQQVLLLPVEKLSQYRQEVERLRKDALLVLFEQASAVPVTVLQLKTDAQVDVHSLPELKQIHLQPANHRVQATLRNSRQLELVNLIDDNAVTAGVNHVTVSDSGRTRLKFTGTWHRISLVGCGIHRLTVEQAKELYVRGVCYIEEVYVPNTMRVVNHATNWFADGVIPDINESTLRELNARLQHCDSEEPLSRDLVATCLAAVQRCERPKSRYHGMQILSLIAEYGMSTSVNELFHIRKNLVPQTSVRPYPEDLHLEAWQADVRLWHSLRELAAPRANLRVRIDNFYYEFFATTGQPSDANYALITESLKLSSYELLENALKQLKPAAPQQSEVGRINHHFWCVGEYVKAIKRLILAMPRLPETTKAVAIEYVLLSLANDMLQTAAQKLLALEPTLTRRIALRIANRHAESKPVFLQLALSVAQSRPDFQGEPA